MISILHEKRILTLSAQNFKNNRNVVYIHTYTLFNLEFKVAKDKLVSSSYKYDFKTTKTRNYNILNFILKRVILQNVALEIRKFRSSKRIWKRVP